MKKIVLMLLIVLPLVVNAQDRKTVKKYKISHRVEMEIDHESGLNDKRTLEEQYFDVDGRLIEFKDWNKEGKIKDWFKYTYTSDGLLETEVTLDAKGNLTKKEVYEYENGLKVKKITYDSKNRITKEKFYEYDFF